MRQEGEQKNRGGKVDREIRRGTGGEGTEEGAGEGGGNLAPTVISKSRHICSMVYQSKVKNLN